MAGMNPGRSSCLGVTWVWSGATSVIWPRKVYRRSGEEHAAARMAKTSTAVRETWLSWPMIGVPLARGARHGAVSARGRAGLGVNDSMGRRLYVGNLPYSATEDQLVELFSHAGKVDNVRVMRDMATGRARGFAFVEMGTDEDAQQAIDEFHEHQTAGRALEVNEARPKPAGGSGGGGGGRGRGGGAGGGRFEDRDFSGGRR